MYGFKSTQYFYKSLRVIYDDIWKRDFHLNVDVKQSQLITITTPAQKFTPKKKVLFEGFH